MDKLATLYGAAKLVAHRFHHLTTGPSFLADHAFLGETYDAYDDAYDMLVERCIGTGEPIDIPAINTESAAQAAAVVNAPTNWANALLGIEVEIRAMIERVGPSESVGTQNLLAQLADESEVRTYKMQQRAS